MKTKLSLLATVLAALLASACHNLPAPPAPPAPTGLPAPPAP